VLELFPFEAVRSPGSDRGYVVVDFSYTVGDQGYEKNVYQNWCDKPHVRDNVLNSGRDRKKS